MDSYLINKKYMYVTQLNTTTTKKKVRRQDRILRLPLPPRSCPVASQNIFPPLLYLRGQEGTTAACESTYTQTRDQTQYLQTVEKPRGSKIYAQQTHKNI